MDDICLSVFRYTAAVDFVQRSGQTGFVQHQMLKFPYEGRKICVAAFRKMVLLCVIKLIYTELMGVFRKKGVEV